MNPEKQEYLESQKKLNEQLKNLNDHLENNKINKSNFLILSLSNFYNKYKKDDKKSLINKKFSFTDIYFLLKEAIETQIKIFNANIDDLENIKNLSNNFINILNYNLFCIKKIDNIKKINDNMSSAFSSSYYSINRKSKSFCNDRNNSNSSTVYKRNNNSTKNTSFDANIKKNSNIFNNTEKTLNIKNKKMRRAKSKVNLKGKNNSKYDLFSDIVSEIKCFMNRNKKRKKNTERTLIFPNNEKKEINSNKERLISPYDRINNKIVDFKDKEISKRDQKNSLNSIKQLNKIIDKKCNIENNNKNNINIKRPLNKSNSFKKENNINYYEGSRKGQIFNKISKKEYKSSKNCNEKNKNSVDNNNRRNTGISRIYGNVYYNENLNLGIKKQVIIKGPKPTLLASRILASNKKYIEEFNGLVNGKKF